jgi:hypothetical protein
MQRFGLEAFSGGPPPEPANHNMTLLREGESPLEVLEWLQRRRAEIRRRLAADSMLLSDPTLRWTVQQLDAIEQCFRWQQSHWK